MSLRAEEKAEREVGHRVHRTSTMTSLGAKVVKVTSVSKNLHDEIISYFYISFSS